MELVTFQSSGFFFNLVSDQFFQVSDQWRLRSAVAATSYVVSDHLPSTGSFAEAAVRQVAINRSPGRSPNRPERRRAGQALPQPPTRSGPDSRQRVRWPDRLGSLAALPRLESFLTRRAGRVAVWGADADRSKLRGAGAARPGGVSSPSIGTPSVCTVVLARTPSSQRVKKPAQKKVQNLIGKKKKGCGILISDKYKLEEGGASDRCRNSIASNSWSKPASTDLKHSVLHKSIAEPNRLSPA